MMKVIEDSLCKGVVVSLVVDLWQRGNPIQNWMVALARDRDRGVNFPRGLCDCGLRVRLRIWSEYPMDHE